MSFTTGTSRTRSADQVNRRLAAGLLVSIVLHALVLSLQFGAPGLGLPSTAAPVRIAITLADTPPPVPPQVAEPVPSVAVAPTGKAPSTGMRLLDPSAPPAPVRRPKPVAKKGKPTKSRRISTPLAPTETPTRVITQDQKQDSQFVVPLPRPEESVRKTIDPNEAQHGSDDGAEAAQAAEQEANARALAETQRQEAIAAREAVQAELAEQARALANEQARQQALQQREDDSRQRAEQERLATDALERAQALRAEQASREAEQHSAALALEARRQADEQARQQAVLRQRQNDELAAQQQAQALAIQAQAQAERQKAEQLAQQQAQQLAARQQAEQLEARRKTEELARRAAEEAARQAAEQAAREQAEQVAAARQRERALAPANAQGGGAAASPGPGASPGGSAIAVPKNLLGSDLGERARAFARGLDILSGAPPRPVRDDDRAPRRVVVGAAERDVPLRMYVDSFRQKIERNGVLNFSNRTAERVRIEPLVSVAIRSDGSVEEVTIVRSSGRADTDEAVRRIVKVNARYSAFPPNIASRYDVIEIRRIWTFEDGLKLLEEVR